MGSNESIQRVENTECKICEIILSGDVDEIVKLVKANKIFPRGICDKDHRYMLGYVSILNHLYTPSEKLRLDSEIATYILNTSFDEFYGGKLKESKVFFDPSFWPKTYQAFKTCIKLSLVPKEKKCTGCGSIKFFKERNNIKFSLMFTFIGKTCKKDHIQQIVNIVNNMNFEQIESFDNELYVYSEKNIYRKEL